MVKQKSKKPRLRAKGSETRHLVPYGLVLASEIMEAGSTAFTRTLFNLFKHLNAFYNCMGQFPFNKELASNSARQFLLLCGELSRSTSEGLWTIKPKFHLFQELAEYKTYTSGDPSGFWSYADESFVGFVSRIAHSRGGPRLADTTPTNVMMKYRGMDWLYVELYLELGQLPAQLDCVVLVNTKSGDVHINRIDPISACVVCIDQIVHHSSAQTLNK